MSGTPYIRFYGDDWLSGTSEMSLQERGALVTIVAITAATGSAPAYDLDRLSRRFGCTRNAAKKVLNALEELGKISIENGTVINARASKEVEISQKNSEKQSEKAKSRWAKSDKKSNENNEGRNAVALPGLCQPEPEPEPKIKKEAKASTKRGTSLPLDWTLSKEWGDWAVSEGWSEQVVRDQAEIFKDYWHSKAGSGATKLDWFATWRNWMRNSKKLKSINGGNYGKPSSKPDQLRGIITAAAEGTSGQDWG